MLPAEIGDSRGGKHRAVESRLIVIHDQPQACPYLDGISARMPLRLPIGRLDPAGIDSLLELGYRRTGDFVYRTECPGCQSCEPTRVIVDRFVWTRSLLRVARRGDRELVTSFGPVVCDDERIALFNRHRQVRGLDRGDGSVDEVAYRAFLVDSCCDSVEMTMRHNGKLAAVAVIDIGRDSVSAVYTHFDPDLARLSLGTYAVLRQIRFAAISLRTYVYLGMYVEANSHLNYKARFLPQQRLIRNAWLVIEPDS